VPTPRLPSISELLESPPLKSLVQTVNPSTILARSRTFLDTIRREAERTTANWQPPSTRDLAERIASWIQLTQSTLPQVAVNATGTFFTPGVSPPLSAEATAAVCHYLGEFVLADSTDPDAHLEKLLLPITGGVGLKCFGSFAAAQHVALTALSAGGKLLVRRSDVVQSVDGGNILEFCRGNDIAYSEVGLVNSTSLDEFKNSLADAKCFWLDAATLTASLATDKESELALVKDLIATARGCGVSVVADARCASLLDLQDYGLTLFTLKKLLDLGIDLLLAEGSGLWGGPECGLLIGSREKIKEITTLPLTKLLQPNPAVREALAETLRIYADPTQAEIKIPVLTLLSTPTENLRLRAERIASQLVQAADIETATPVEVESNLWEKACPTAQLPGWGIQLQTTPAFGIRVKKLCHPAVLLASGDNRPLINLRTVPTRQDVTLTAMLCGGGEAASEASE
jgi:L-seryl-tRNA(Ser) seleniumtransferase